MYITGMRKPSSIWPYIKGDEADGWNSFEFDKQVNLFVGPNAAGKTRLLNILSDRLFAWNHPNDAPVHVSYSENVRDWLKTSRVFSEQMEGRRRRRIVIELPVVNVDVVRPDESLVGDKLTRMFRDMEESRSERDDAFTDDDRRTAGQKRVPGYEGRTARDVLNEKLEIEQIATEYEMVENMAMGLSMSQNTDNAGSYAISGEEMITIDEEDIFMYMTRSSSRCYANFRKALVLSFHCAKDICAEVIASNVPVDQSTLVENQGAMPSARVDFGVQIATTDNDVLGKLHNPLHISNLSTGTAGTLWWIRLLAIEMLLYYEFQFGWEKQPAILLVDEIENHLHPSWQRRVIPALQKYFPNVQIFATTHSPFVVAGLKAGQVHMLKRDANGVITASTNEHDIIGWTTDEILRTFMGVDEPTDQLTVDRRERLLELRRKDALTDAEAAEMEALRRQVNEDFLSSSTPLGAQRERYGDMMLEFLRSRQSELSQDGS